MKQPFVPVVAAVAVAVCTAMPAQAQVENYPSKPVTIIVPFAPGGGTDIITRIVAQRLSERLKQPVVVENRAGAGGNIGADYVARAKNDGYTILAGAIVAHAVNMTLQSGNIHYDLAKSFAPITYLSSMPVTLVVNKELPVKSAGEFIDYVRRRPGQIAYASAGVGSTQHLAGEYFQQLTGTKMMHIGYKGSGPAMTDVVAGQVPVTFEVGAVVYPQLKSGKLTPLMTARKERTPAMKDVPVASEVGVNGFEVATIYALLAPAGTPTPIIDRLNKEVGQILQLPDVRQKFAEQGADPIYTTPAETAERIRAEIARWATVVKTSGMTVQ
jgi:tripartite-type tricarboxylate transporter receptor subunit TctC